MPSSTHPRVAFLFYLDEPADATWRQRMEDFIAWLADRRRWLLGPPAFVDEVDDGEVDDDPVETLGGVLDLYDAHPPHVLEVEIDRQQLAEVETIIDAVQKLSRETEATFRLPAWRR